MKRILTWFQNLVHTLAFRLYRRTQWAWPLYFAWPVAGGGDPIFSEIPASTLNEIKDGIVFDNFFVDTPLQRYFRAEGALDPFYGGAAMQVPLPRNSLRITRIVTRARSGSSAPRQRRGRNGLIGVSANSGASIGMIGPCTERL